MFRAKQGDPSKLGLKRRLRIEMTFAERQLWFRLSSKQLRSLKFRRQHGVGPYIVDFYCPEKGVVIEVDGNTHTDEDQKIKDKERERYLESLGLQVIRYTNQEVLKNLDGVLEDLNKKLVEGFYLPLPLLTKEGHEKERLKRPTHSRRAKTDRE